MGVGGTHLNSSVTSLVPVPSSQTMVADTHPLPSQMQVAETLPNSPGTYRVPFPS